ncbi:creatininase family protein [Kutzneria sp. 744]|uniref:creatininase family protein n=1 Tax=Kutzneria sp. (strain 744) TaxID=345341 RepID=UPI0003EEB9D6|nr:creatininase family protein [Kutzneria sp. 744]EWM18352.1 creatininase [Kutzneria sp. 744]
MTYVPRTHRLADLTWPEIDELRPHAPVAIVPLGATEQHGLGMAQRTDTARAEAVADMVARRMSPQVVVTPTIPVGMSEHHMAFPGTLTLSPVTLQQIVVELVTSLHRHGWRRIFVLTGHGGNNAAVDVAVSRLRAEFTDTHIAWSGVTPVVSDLVKQNSDSPVRGHACEIETSQALYVDPDLVLPDRLVRGSATLDDLDPAGRLARSHPGIQFPQGYDALSRTGNLGDPRLATAELGALLVDAVVDRVCDFLTGLIGLPDRSPAPPPAHIALETS